MMVEHIGNIGDSSKINVDQNYEYLNTIVLYCLLRFKPIGVS